MNRNLTTSFIKFNNLIHMFNLKFRINTLRKHIISNGKNIHITGSLTITKKSSLYSLCAGKKCKSVIVTDSGLVLTSALATSEIKEKLG